MTRLQKTGEYLRFNSSLPTKLNEFATILTERQLTQQYEFDEHAPLALKAGLNSEILKAVAEGRRREGMAADEETVYDFCVELRQNLSVSDTTYARAVSSFGEQA
jgi:4-carboxymuconolactone decarboxylase